MRSNRICALICSTGIALVFAITTMMNPVSAETGSAGLEANLADLRVITLGDSGTLVSFWQDRLNTWMGLADVDGDALAVDGIYGPLSQAATESFQSVTDSVVTDGVVNPADRVALDNAIAGLEANDR
ncbi:MAG: hypothetical protein ABIQ73_14410, partial [Acidimicrobiales bacterium]